MRKLVAVAIAALAAMATPLRAEAHENFVVGDAAKEAEFVALINQLRADQGLPALTSHPQLVTKARRWSHTMADAGEIWHSDLPDGIRANWRRLGENVGMGGSVAALHDAFVASPGHYKNLVDPGFRHVGIGVTVDAEGTIFVSEVFMELASQPAPAASRSTAGTPPPPPAQRADAPPPRPPAPNPPPQPPPSPS